MKKKFERTKEDMVLIDGGDLTPSNISRWIATLKEGESLDFSMHEGRLRVRLYHEVNGKRRWIPLRNKIMFSTSPLPLSSTSLVSSLNDPMKRFSKFGNVRKYEGTERLSKGEKLTAMIRASMLAELSTMSMEDASAVVTPHGKLFEFDMGDGVTLRVTGNKVPVALIEDGETVYL